MSKQRSIDRPLGHHRELLALTREFSLHPADNQQVILNFYSSLDTPVSLACALLYKYGEFDQLVSKEIDPTHYNDAETFKDDFASVAFLRKHETLKTSFDRKKLAISAFQQAEITCKSTNDRIKSYLTTGSIPNGLEWLINSAIRKIDRILGPFCIDTVLDLCNWGPGVTLSIKGCDTSASHKFDRETDVTRDLYRLFSSVATAAYPIWDAWSKPTFVVGNTIITVPKNAKVDRTIAVEPGLNLWVQKGIGAAIRGRLRRAGYNLDSDLKNHRGAYLGSVYDQIATVDFKAASDTISLELVRLLLPPDWFDVLDAARSQYYTLDKNVYPSNKFSTMGNGFTFELESLIFLAFGLASCEQQGVDDQAVSIYGDDLVVPSVVLPQLTDVCTFAGFTLNSSKSFSTGPFRESCGVYYFNGQDVKPVYFRRDLLKFKDIYRFLNSVRELAHRRTGLYGCDARLRSLWSLALHKLPEKLRLYGPTVSGDACIHENIREGTRRPSGQIEGFLFSGFPEVSMSIEKDSHGVLLQRLNTPSRDLPYGNKISLRARTKIVFKKSMFVHRWYELGPWV
jgi:hypothetical protein